MEFTLSGNQLTYFKENIVFFKILKDGNIQLDLKMNNKIQNDVLSTKTVSSDGCPDITKLSLIKSDLENCNGNKIKIKKITIELECV